MYRVEYKEKCREEHTDRSMERSSERKIWRFTVSSTERSTVRMRQSRGPLMFDYIILTVGTNYQLP